MIHRRSAFWPFFALFLSVSPVFPPQLAHALRVQEAAQSTRAQELTAGMEEESAERSYREGVARVRAAMQRFGVQTTLTPGEVWMLGQLADPAGYLVVGGLDQKFEKWLPAIGHPDNQKEWDVRYRMTIAARLSRELVVHQQEAPWRTGRPLYSGRIGFVFSRSVITNPYFSQLRNGSVPIEMEDHLPPNQTLKDVRFLAQGNNSAVPRWRPVETEMTVEEATAAGAVGYKTSVMLPVQLDRSAYAPYWKKLTDQNLVWVQERAKETHSAFGGLGVGYLAGTLLWAAPPKDFAPPVESLTGAGRSLEQFQREMDLEQPEEWALDLLMKAWLASDQKKEIEQSEQFSSAHAELTHRVVEAWNQTPGITLIQTAGPYFVSAQGELDPRVVPARQTIGRLAELPGLKGKIVPATRNRLPVVFHKEFTWMADAGLAGAVTVGRSLLRSLIDGRTERFRFMSAHMFRQGVGRAAVDLLIGIDQLREKQAPGIWSAYGITPVQAEQLIQISRSATGVEEAMTATAVRPAANQAQDRMDPRALLRALKGNRGFLETEQFLDRFSREQTKFISSIAFLYDVGIYWDRLTQPKRIFLLRWLESKAPELSTPDAAELYDFFDHVSINKTDGRIAKAWALRGMIQAARTAAQNGKARQRVEAFLQDSLSWAEAGKRQEVSEILSAAGTEELRVEVMDIDDFERPWKTQLKSSQHQQIEAAKKAKARYAIILPLPLSMTIYAQGDQLLFSAEQSLRIPSDLQVAVEPLSDQVKEWDEMGYILANAGLPDEPLYNPRNLPYQHVWPDQIQNIDPLKLLAAVLARHLRLSNTAVVGQMIYQNSDQARLVLFSRDA
ncbi:MAG: hypothetical protein HYZ88_01370 [Candidatus Omnitrophica bacterium]|nr:hypothetical protein [Candidatus Omnitrophota bacterium]